MKVDLSVNGRTSEIEGHPMERLLDVLREGLGLTGTKEGCGEGECGACTVLIDGEPTLSCLVPLFQCEGRRIETVEGIAEGPARGFLERFVLTGGVQCGACTPGIVVTAWALLQRNPAPSREEAREALAGNLSRCTGYGVRRNSARDLSGAGPVIAAVRPRSLEEAVRHLGEDPSLVPTAGCTDLMVRGPEALHRMDRVIDLLGVPELRGIREIEGGIEIGATTSFSEIRRSAAVRGAFPILAEAAALMAAGPEGLREIPYSEFHTSYRRTALRPGEIVARVRIPYLPAGAVQAFRKVGTREAQAISKVVVALAGRIEEGRIAELRLAAGSVAAVPVRLRAAEAAVRGQAPGPEAADLAGREAAREVKPIDDVRSTADYRRFALERVVRRMVLEIGE